MRILLACCLSLVVCEARAELRAGAAAIDVTPLKFPVLVNGGMLSRSIEKVKSPIYARAIVLDDGKTRLGIVVVDSCMMPRPLLDEAKQLASQRTKIAPQNMLISATHTHTAPSSMGALGTPADPTYVPYLREKLAESLAAAEKNLAPAQVGWGVGQAPGFTALRPWIRRPDRIANDPFGNPTVRANMHAGRNWDDVVGESGPEDPSLSMISIQSREGRPLAVLANFSMHYFGDREISSDYFGLFCKGLEQRLAGNGDRRQPPLVGIMSHGCSGDIWRRDYKLPEDRRSNPQIEEYSNGLLDIAVDTYRGIKHTADADLAMAERRLTLDYRTPDEQRLEWAKRVTEEMGDRLPKTQPEVYAMEQIILHERKQAEIVVQAVRIGDIGIATTPNETYALTGLKLKLQSPLPNTMVIELANGGDGYIPPPEQHQLGGYNTWPARSAGLEVQAEPKITEAALQLLEEVASKPRRVFRQSRGPACKALLAASPVAYFRLDEMAGPLARDSSGNHVDGQFETGMAYFLDGAPSDLLCDDGELNRAAHFAGGRLRCRSQLADRYSVSMWVWNGMPVDARGTTGWALSRGREHGLSPHGDHLGLGGTDTKPGKLVFLHGDDLKLARTGRGEIPRWTWAQVVLVRDGNRVRVYLNGKLDLEAESTPGLLTNIDTMFFGGRCDGSSGWEGRLDEIAVFDRPLSEAEVRKRAPNP